MKKLLILGIAAITFTACNTEKTDDSGNDTGKEVTQETKQNDYTISTEESILDWKGSMAGVYDHEGTITFKDGEMSVKDGKVVSGNFTVDMNSMLTTDDDALYVNAPREKLIEHLQADDFFATDLFPTASFTVKSSEGNVITGNLTIRGETNSEKVTDVILSEENGDFTATGKLVFDRQKYEVTYESKMKDMVLSDDIELEIHLKGKVK